LGPGRGLLIWGYFTAISPEIGAGADRGSAAFPSELYSFSHIS
jgi:hypothetical protein